MSRGEAAMLLAPALNVPWQSEAAGSLLAAAAVMSLC